MRRLQRRAGPLDEPIDIRAGKLRRGHLERLLALAAPHGDLHALLVGGGLTSCTVSRLLSRKRMVRDSGSSSGSMPAISVLRACIWLSAPSPTTHTGSPAVSSRGVRWADFTGVAPMRAGS